MADLERRFRQQQAVVQLGQRALASVPLAALMDETARLVAGTLETELVGVFEPDADRRSFSLRAGVGWDPTVVGSARLPGGFRSSTGFALLASGPVVSEDLKAETRFEPDPLFTQHGVIRGDAARIEQIVWNLLTNAVKFTDAGGNVTLGAVRDAAHVRIDVSDTGAGIPAELLPYVFDRFRQDRPPARTHASGLGLGLAIVRDLVKLHGGTVSVESDGVGRGATFTVLLPVVWRT